MLVLDYIEDRRKIKINKNKFGLPYMTFLDGCHSLKLECALRNLGFVDIGWKCVAHAGLFFIEPYALEENPDADLLGFNIKKSKNIVKLIPTAKKALDFALYEA